MTNITAFDLDPIRAEVLQECVGTYSDNPSDAEWPNNILSCLTVVYESGVIARRGDSVIHNVDPDELERCESLACDALEMLGEIDVVGSEADDPFFEFFICNNADADCPDAITETLIRQRFGSTIFPPATITVEPLEASGVWWSEVMAWVSKSNRTYRDEYLGAWRRLMAWFSTNPELSSASFVRIGDCEALWQLQPSDMPEGTEMTGSVLPRMAVALTKAGSLVGIFGYSVQT